MVVKRIPCDFIQSMYVSQGTCKMEILSEPTVATVISDYRWAVEGPEVVMSIHWAEEPVHAVSLPTQLIVLTIVTSVLASHWSDYSWPLIGQWLTS